MSDFTSLVDLASERLGGAVLAVNDEFFAPKERLLGAGPPAWKEGVYDERGKWMDGWETRRRRDGMGGHDWAIIRLGLPGIVRGVVVDTAFFRGNYPERCAVDACELAGTPDVAMLERAPWKVLVGESPLSGDTRNILAAAPDAVRATHVRLRIYPDGGVARLRVHGEVVPNWGRLLQYGGLVDLAAMENGGRVVGQSDAFYANAGNMLQPGRSTFMEDGWETRRRRGPGHDWAIIKLGARGTLVRAEVDTDYFKGNAPATVSLDATNAESDEGAELATWTQILSQSKLQPHARHQFDQLKDIGSDVTHVRVNIYPDGGIARLRLFGTVTASAR